MKTRETLISLGQKEIDCAMRSIDIKTAEDVYAISFYVWAYDNDVRRSCITIGFNTEENFSNQRESERAEARWNYAMWLQNQVCEFPNENSGSIAIWKYLLDELSINYTDKEADEAFDSGLDFINMELVSRLIVDIAVELSNYCHSSGLLDSVFGKTIPIIVHELEYYEAIAIVTEAANPPDAAEEFMKWMEPCFRNSECNHKYPSNMPDGKFYF